MSDPMLDRIREDGSCQVEFTIRSPSRYPPDEKYWVVPVRLCPACLLQQVGHAYIEQHPRIMGSALLPQP